MRLFLKTPGAVSHRIKGWNMNLCISFCLQRVHSLRPPLFSKKDVKLFQSSWEVGCVLLWGKPVKLYQIIPPNNAVHCIYFHWIHIFPISSCFFNGLFFLYPSESGILRPENVIAAVSTQFAFIYLTLRNRLLLEAFTISSKFLLSQRY